ncbi:RNA polymerase sigma factor [Maribacter sp. ACAM166]|uniref:RNA polymerase sigma factor n=1 Tax=Maribacter sp. ACAM166 TaxID=2508996 RepID=UPI0010FE6390|nr:sigma-70 family RNA polymerase sigma factor [Maribacter sp. ACAM166]TLP80803.1 sigma-70 family RNA polymerase sigma factor [Maribacter sp. ACAM166]
MSLEELIHNCKKNNRKAQELLYRAYATTLFGICLKYSNSKTEAEDNLHDSFITIYEKIGQFKGTGSFEGWMKRITINTVLQKYRREEYLSAVSDNTEEEITVVNAYSDICLQSLLRYIQELPNKYRATFNLYVLDGYTHKEISELLGTSIGTSKSNLARARTLLKQKIETKVSQSIIGILMIITTHFL